MPILNKAQMICLYTTGGLALACSKSSLEDKGTELTPTQIPTRAAGNEKDTKSTEKAEPPKPNPKQNPATVSSPPSIEPSLWIARLGEGEQGIFPPFAGAQRVSGMPHLCTGFADAGHLLYIGGGVAFCTPGAEYPFSYDYEEPVTTNQKVRSIAVVSPWDQGLKATPTSTAPWILVDIVKETSEVGSVGLSLSLKGTHKFSRLPKSDPGGLPYVNEVFTLPNLESDGSMPNDGGAYARMDLLSYGEYTGLGGLQIKLSAQGPAGSLEFKIGAKTLVLEPQWKPLSKILPASSFAFPSDGTFVQAGVPTLTTPPMGTIESDLKCPGMAFAPVIWNISGTRKFRYCHGGDALLAPSLRNVPASREHVNVRYDVGAKDGFSAYSVGIVVDDCSLNLGQLECDVLLEFPGGFSGGGAKTGQPFSARGITVAVREAAGVLDFIKIRGLGAAPEIDFSARQFPN